MNQNTLFQQRSQKKLLNALLSKQKINQNIQIQKIESESNDSQQDLGDNLKNRRPFRPIILFLFKLFSFVLNFSRFLVILDYSVENALITMLMITFLTPNIIDSFIWIVPNIISILIRPYLVRYVHRLDRKHQLVNQIFLINFFLLLGSIGVFIVRQSTIMNKQKNKLYALRILICSIGWTFSGFSFELCEYFIERLKKSIEQQFYIKIAKKMKTREEKHKNINDQKQEFGLVNFQQIDKASSLWQNFRFYGFILGYLVVLTSFMIFSKNKLKAKDFLESIGSIYTITGFITLFASISSYIIASYSGISKLNPQVKAKPIVFKISYSINYYLPGLAELRFISLKGLAFLGVHFIVNFVIDVVFIYTTMWTANCQQTANMNSVEANFYGVKYGVFYLIVFTIIFYGHLVPVIVLNDNFSFQLISILCSILFLSSYWFNSSLVYFTLIMTVAIFLKCYENHIQSQLEGNGPQIKVAKELIVRIQKIVVFSLLPFATMIILGRDDVKDCLIWCAGILLFVSFILSFNKYRQMEIRSQTQEEKIRTA